MSDHHHSHVIFASSIERRSDEAVADLSGVEFAGSEHGLDILVLQHLGQPIRAEQDQVLRQYGKRGDGGFHRRPYPQGTGQHMPFGMSFRRFCRENTAFQVFFDQRMVFCQRGQRA